MKKLIMIVSVMWVVVLAAYGTQSNKDFEKNGAGIMDDNTSCSSSTTSDGG